MWHVWGKRSVHTGFWWGRPEGNRPLEDLGVDGMTLKQFLRTRIKTEKLQPASQRQKSLESSGAEYQNPFRGVVPEEEEKKEEAEEGEGEEEEELVEEE